MLRKFAVASFVLLFVLVAGSSSFADIALPEAQKNGGMPIFEALDQRASGVGGSFPAHELNVKDLSQMLWAASGLNRNGQGWTIPLTKGKPPYCKIYVATASGVHLYDWKEHKLIEVTKKDIRVDVNLQEFAKTVPCIFIFVMDAEVLGGTDEAAKSTAMVTAGSMSQNIYLASEGFNIGVRYIMSLDYEKTAKELNLPKGNIPLGAVLLGKYVL